MPFCLELSRHILKMIERDPRRPTLSAVVLLGFQSKANYVDRQKKITNLALVIAKNRRQVTGHIALKTNKFRGHRFRSYSLLKGESRAHLLTDTLPLAP